MRQPCPCFAPQIAAFPPQVQAAAVVGAVGGAMGGNVATKTDIAELKADMLKIAIGIVVANAGLTASISNFCRVWV